jgi:hypothetical protein
MNSTQHEFINILVQGASESRAELRDLSADVLMVLIIATIFGLGLLWWWILRGGFSSSLSLRSSLERRAFENLLHKP